MSCVLKSNREALGPRTFSCPQSPRQEDEKFRVSVYGLDGGLGYFFWLRNYGSASPDAGARGNRAAEAAIERPLGQRLRSAATDLLPRIRYQGFIEVVRGAIWVGQTELP